MGLEEIVFRLTGEITPVGESREDAKRLENLHTLAGLMNELLLKMNDAAEYKNRAEHSMKLIGEQADKFLSETRDWLNDT